MNEPYRLRYANQIVGVFLLIILVLLLVLLVLFLRAGEYFVEKDNYWIEIAQEDVQDLYRGAEVMILGERAGQVESIRYVPGSDKIRVDLSITPEKSDEIFPDSAVLLERKFGLGTPILVIRRGPTGSRVETPLPSGSRIDSFQGEPDRIDRMAREVESVSESVRRIQQQLDPTLSEIRDSADRFRLSLDDSVDPAFEQTRRASESFYETNETVRPDAVETLQVIRDATADLQTRVAALTDSVSQLVEADMRDTLGGVRESTQDVSAAANRVNQTSQQVNDDIAESLARIRQAAEEVRLLADESRDVVRIVRQEARDLPGTTARVNDTLHETQDMVDEIRSHWLLRRYSTRTESTPQVSPSVIRGGPIR